MGVGVGASGGKNGRGGEGEPEKMTGFKKGLWSELASKPGSPKKTEIKKNQNRNVGHVIARGWVRVFAGGAFWWGFESGGAAKGKVWGVSSWNPLRIGGPDIGTKTEPGN